MQQNEPYNAKAPGIACGVTEDVIKKLVHAFYGKVRVDPVLGPIFCSAIQDWDAHLSKLCDFWSSITLMTGKYKGQPVPAHLALPGIHPTHFVRWLHLFSQTAEDVCTPEAAQLFISRAEKVAESLQLAIAMNKGELTVKPPSSTRKTTGLRPGQ